VAPAIHYKTSGTSHPLSRPQGRPDQKDQRDKASTKKRRHCGTSHPLLTCSGTSHPQQMSGKIVTVMVTVMVMVTVSGDQCDQKGATVQTCDWTPRHQLAGNLKERRLKWTMCSLPALLHKETKALIGIGLSANVHCCQHIFGL